MRFSFLLVLAVAGIGPLPACGGNTSSDAEPVGVDDVRKAYEVRRSWKNPTSELCIRCQSAAPLADCGCEAFAGFGGKCVQRQDAMKSEPSCTSDLTVCVKTCSVTDCDCIDTCYAKAAACRTLAGARDGCVAEICATYCN